MNRILVPLLFFIRDNAFFIPIFNHLSHPLYILDDFILNKTIIGFSPDADLDKSLRNLSQHRVSKTSSFPTFIGMEEIKDVNIQLRSWYNENYDIIEPDKCSDDDCNL